jgi:solute carrier family 35 protein F1/2
VLVYSDYLSSDGSDASGTSVNQMVAGDFLCLAAATLYAISNVGQESIVKAHDRTEFLGMLGCFGLAINTIQLLILERDELARVNWSSDAPGYVVGFALSLFCMYSLTSIFLQKCDATMFNLSLLTSDIWAIFASVILFHRSLHPLYFLALLIIATGLVVYNVSPQIESASDQSAELEAGPDTPSHDSVYLNTFSGNHRNTKGEQIPVLSSLADIEVDVQPLSPPVHAHEIPRYYQEDAASER